MRCAHCGNDFKPTLPARAEQRFCSDYCRKRWHQLVHKRARYEAEIEAAEERMNGHAPQEIDVRSLLASVRPPAPPPAPNFKRRI
jgi:hypothetical protein